MISGVIKNEGLSTLYTGLSAGLLRQATYTTTRYTFTPPPLLLPLPLGFTLPYALTLSAQLLLP